MCAIRSAAASSPPFAMIYLVLGMSERADKAKIIGGGEGRVGEGESVRAA